MGQKCNPIGLRLGFIKGWDSNWFGGKNYGEKIVEDDKIRKYLMARLKKRQYRKLLSSVR
jgi:small subunit ribosomal protein S3